MGSLAGLGIVSIHKEKPLDSVGGRGEQIAAKTEPVPVSAVDAGDGFRTHRRDLMRDGNAGDGRSPEMVVRDKEGVGNRRHHSDLLANRIQIRACRRFNLAYQLEPTGRHRKTVQVQTRPPVRFRAEGLGVVWTCPATRTRKPIGWSATVSGGPNPVGGIGRVG